MRTSEIVSAKRVLLVAFVGYTLFALCFNGIFYLFEYRNSDSIAPAYVKLQKDLVWTIVLSLVFYMAVQTRNIQNLLQPYNVILLSFCCWVVAVKVVELFAYETYSVLLLTVKNLVLYAAMVPLLGMLGDQTKRSVVKQVLAVFVAVALIQSAFSAALFILFPEYAFWKDDPYFGFNPFVGLFSNPNRFGLFLNLAAAVLCTTLMYANARRALFAAVGLLILALSIFYSAALSQLIVYFGLLGYATAVAALTLRWRCLRLPAVMIAAILSIGFVGLNFKSPLSDETHQEAALARDLRNMASLALYGKTLDGEEFRFTSDSFVNRGREIRDLMESFGYQKSAHKAGEEIQGRVTKAPLQQRLFGRPDQIAPNSQSQFAYIYFRYGLVGLFLFVGVLVIPAVRSFFAMTRRHADQTLLSYHLCLVAFIATFVGDNGLLDYPTNFLLFFVLFACQSLVGLSAKPVVELGVTAGDRRAENGPATACTR
jgi:hypothetical protein